MLDRISRLTDIIPDEKTAIFITSQVNRLYYSDFLSSSGALLVTKNKTLLLVDFRYFEAASKKCDGIEVICYK